MAGLPGFNSTLFVCFVDSVVSRDPNVSCYGYWLRRVGI